MARLSATTAGLLLLQQLGDALAPYTPLPGIVPVGGVGNRSVAVGFNHSLGTCEAACDALLGCQGFTVDAWALTPPSMCLLWTEIARLVDAPCSSSGPGAQLAAFFTKSSAKPTIPGPAPYLQFAGLMPLHRPNTSATITCNGNWTLCTEACDTDPLCVGINLIGCSPEAPGSTCWLEHAPSVPSLVANTIDSACYYQKPSVPPVPTEKPLKTWKCHTAGGPTPAPGPPVPPAPPGECPNWYPFGCKFGLSQWSDGSRSFNCKMRKLAWEFGRQKRPDYGQFEDLYYALGLNHDCLSEVPLPIFSAADRAYAPKLYPRGTNALYVDYAKGSDSNRGSFTSPFKTIQAAVDAAAHEPRAIVNLRGGTHYLSTPVHITSANAGLTIQNYHGEAVIVSGAVRLYPKWEKYEVATAGPGANAYAADVSEAQLTEFPGFQVNGARVTRARFPNGNVELPERTQPDSGNRDGILLMAGTQASWIPPDHTLIAKAIQIKNTNPAQMRNGSINGPVGGPSIYTEYMGGIGGPCARYDPPFSYWCSTAAAGGGAHVTEVCRGVTPSKSAIAPVGGNATAGLHMPYKTMTGAIVNAMHEARWANWMWEVADYNATTNKITFGQGGFQESRGSLHNSGGDWFIENVFEEFDSPNEWFWDQDQQKLYFYYNGTGAPPTDALYEVPQLRTLFNMTSSRWQPIYDVTIKGLTLTGTRYTYMDPHGVPSAGDFAVARSAAVVMDGTIGATVADCNITRVDGNGLIVSGFNRNATVAGNTFSWVGDNAIVVWGRTNETAANPLEGFDGTDGNHPQDTIIANNVIREIGIYEKQSGWYFQAKAARSIVRDNVMFNAPRNGITFNDPFAGGDLITGNLAFSAMRETSDGGTYNSWDRQPFLTLDPATGKATPFMAWREISYNFFINNYHMEMNIDTDDGTSYVKAHHNFLVGGEWALKSDAGGHSNWQYENINAYATGPAVNDFNAQAPGLEDRFFNNTVIQLGGSIVGSTSPELTAALCGMVNVTGTRAYTRSGRMPKCLGGPSFDATGVGNSVATLPPDDDVIVWARKLLSVAVMCTSDLDCSLNGGCIGSVCHCDAAWRGDACDRLALVPTSISAPTAYGGNHSMNVSSWGGNILRADDGQYHLWVSEFAEGCGLTAWLNNSMISHATAATPMGPFTKHDTSLGIFAHNVVPVRAPPSFGTGARPYYLFHIGNGNSSGTGNGAGPPTYPWGPRSPVNCSGRPTPHQPQNQDMTTRSFEDRREALPPSWGNLAHRAPTPNGPWEPIPSMYPPCNNPSPLWHPNGTLFLGCNPTQSAIPLFSSPDGGFTWKPAGEITMPSSWAHCCASLPYLGVEDGFLYLDARGGWHLLVHRYNYTNGAGVLANDILVAGHAFSRDGVEWHFADTPPYDSELPHTDAPPTPFTSLERPHLVIDERTRQATHLVLAAAPKFTSPLCSGCLSGVGGQSSCVMCKGTPGIDSTYTVVVALGADDIKARD